MSNTDQQSLRKPANNASDTESQFLDAISRARNGLRFGSIEITVHDGKVTQIERKEKIRFQS